MSSYGKIPNRLIDRTTILERQLANNEKTIITKILPNGHTQFSHLFCILLRIFLGILVISGLINSNVLIVFSLIVIVGFGSKFLSFHKKNKPIWKNYTNLILSYSIVIITQLLNLPNKNKLSGLMMIMDALLSQQSRYIATNMIE